MGGHGYLRLSLLHVVGLLAFSHVVYGEEYLLSLHTNGKRLVALTEVTGNWIQVGNHNRHSLTPHSHNKVPFDSSMRTTSGIENKSVIVNISDPSVRIYFEYVYSVSSLLPISALGTKYIVSSCHPSGNYTSVLVIATHSQKTDVDITFRLEGNVTYDDRTYSDGDTLTLNLEKYQTFTIGSDFDLTGTVVSTIQTVAVFTVTIYRNEVSASGQLLPVQQYGHEFIVATDDKDTFQIQIMSEHSDTQITFNNGTTVSVGDRGIYRQSLTQNTSFYFSSSRPVMTTMCKLTGTHVLYIGFVVVPPVRLYTKQTSIFSYDGPLNVLTDKDAIISIKRYNWTVSTPGQWKEIPGTRYKVGTWHVGRAPYFITSSTSFTVLFLSDFTTYNGGYNFPSTPTQCDDHTYGHSCSLLCAKRHCSGNSSCHHVTGSCDVGCESGWMGQDCRKDCDDLRYGDSCSSLCAERHCSGNSSCHHVTGSCDFSCESGWMGQDCRTGCDREHYGSECVRSCGNRHCDGDSSCSPSTGQCDGGCQAGWVGIDCTGCDREHYGPDCAWSCANRHCDGGSSCSPSTGQCDGGCQEGWAGMDCTEPITVAQTTTVIVGGIVAAVLILILVVVVGIVVWRRRAYSASERKNNNSALSGIHHKTGSEAIDIKQNISDDDEHSRGMSRERVYETIDSTYTVIDDTHVMSDQDKSNSNTGFNCTSDVTARDVYEPAVKTYEGFTSRDQDGVYTGLQ